MNNVGLGELACGWCYDIVMATTSSDNRQYSDTLGGRIHWARKNKHMTLKDLAAVVGLKHSHLSGVENNKVNLSLDAFAALCDALDVSADWLLGKEVGVTAVEPAAIGITPEAERAADIIDELPESERRRVLAVIAAMTGKSKKEDASPPDDLHAEREQWAGSVKARPGAING